MKALPRAPEGASYVVVQGDVWDDVCSRLERLENLTVAPPLNLAQMGSGQHLSITEQRIQFFWAITSADSFTDNRYTVTSARVSNDGDAADAKTTIEAYPSTDQKYIQVTATNFNEQDTHDLPTGTQVLVFWDYDKHSPNPTKRYWFFGRFHGMTDLRFNNATGVVQVSYSLKPEDELLDSDWVDKWTLRQCTPAAP